MYHFPHSISPIIAITAILDIRENIHESKNSQSQKSISSENALAKEKGQ